MAIAPNFYHRPARHFLWLCGLVSGLVILFAGGVQAADNLTFDPSLTQNFSWESNPLLLTGSHSMLFGSTTAPTLTIKDMSPTTLLNARLSLDENIFNQTDFDSTDAHGSINLDKKMERWEATLIGQSDYDTTRTSELTTLDIDTIGAVRHYGNSVTPEISYSPDTIDKLSLAASAQDSKYDSDLLTDYHIFSVTPAYQHDFTPMSSGIFSVQAQRYQTDSSFDATVDSVAPSVEWTQILTPTWTAKATLGAEAYRQEGDNSPNQQWQWQTIYSADLSYKDERDVFSLEGYRSLQPYANGTEYFLTTFSLTDAHTLNTLFSSNATASYQFASASDQAATNLKSLINADFGIAYHVTEKLDITASYQYREQTLTNVPGNQDDNLFMLGIALNSKPNNKI